MINIENIFSFLTACEVHQFFPRFIQHVIKISGFLEYEISPTSLALRIILLVTFIPL